MRRVILAVVLSACGGADVAPDAVLISGEHLPGYVSISSSRDATFISATFEDGTDRLSAGTPVGDCLLGGYIIDRYPKSFDAGDITVEGSTSRMLTKTRGTLGELVYQYSSNSQDFLDNELIGVSSTGATVPMFATVIAMPTTATIARPASNTIRLDQPLEVTWTGGSGVLFVRLSSGGQWITCPFPASSGAGVIPVDTLTALRPDSGYFWFFTRNETTLPVGPWDVEISTYNRAVFQDGTVADIQVTVE